MEKIEFYIIGEQTCIRRADGVGKPLTPADRDAIEFMLDQIQRIFPQAAARLYEWAADSAPNKMYFEYRVVDRFIRCNFGEADFLHSDIDDNMFHFEEVRCPLRGICKDQGVICKPKPNLGLSKEEERVAMLYSKGYMTEEIAAKLGKNENTCKVLLQRAGQKLKVPKLRDLIKIFSSYSL